MANRTFYVCPVPRCGQLTRGGRCEKHRVEYMAARNAEVRDALSKADEVRRTPRPVPTNDRTWIRFRAAWLAQHPVCVRCGGTDHLQVHHLTDTRIAPDRVYDPTNLVTMCRSCHGRESFRRVMQRGRARTSRQG